MSAHSEPVCIVGAGPGGLLAAAALKKRGISFEIIDAGSQPGGIWDIDRPETPMYESAHFISSRTLSGLPGFPMPEEYADYPRHDRILAYIRSFAEHHDLVRHITLNRTVETATRRRDGGWRISLDSGEERTCSALCVAAGTTWHPHLPDLPGDFSGEAYHSFSYRSPREFEGKRVLIVGGGNSATDIACDAARSADHAFISLRRGYHFIPKYIFGQPADVFAHAGPQLPRWLEERLFGFLMNRILVGDLTQYGLPKPDHPILRSHPILNTQILHHLGHGDLEARPDISAIDEGSITFVDGTTEEIDLVIWATGYEKRFPFLSDEDLDREGEVIDLYLNVFHRRHPDLFFVGVFETDGAAYGLYGEQVELIASYLDTTLSAGAREVFDRSRTSDRTSLRGGVNYLATSRHDYYVKADAYHKALRKAARALGI